MKAIKRKDIIQETIDAQKAIFAFWDKCFLLQPANKAQMNWYVHFRLEMERCRVHPHRLETNELIELAERLLIFGNMMMAARGLIITEQPLDNDAENVYDCCETLSAIL